MAVADDLDRATDSAWDWVAEHTRRYLASGGTDGHESNGVHTLVLATTLLISAEYSVAMSSPTNSAMLVKPMIRL